MITLDTVTLPADLFWSDEFSWTPVAQKEGFAVTGSLLIDTSSKQAGRPITLQPFTDAYSWVRRSVVLQLQALAAIQDRQMVLTLDDGRIFSVMFRHGGGVPFEAVPKLNISPAAATAFYKIIIRLIEV